MIITSKKSTSSLDGSTCSVKTTSPGSICRPVSEQEAQTIEDLRTVVPSLQSVDDAYVLRWLRSKEGRFDETAEGLRKNMTFRKAWDLDHIGQWTAPEILEKYCGYGFLSDRDGNPILMSLLGNMDVEGRFDTSFRLGAMHQSCLLLSGNRSRSIPLCPGKSEERRLLSARVCCAAAQRCVTYAL
ncbi:Protein CTG-1 a [Aphelenchoides avenae]|nr:Protein CTG-1 a [Aphelenchus avenae]